MKDYQGTRRRRVYSRGDEDNKRRQIPFVPRENTLTISAIVATYNNKSNLSYLVKLFSFCLYLGSYVLKLFMEACLSINYPDWLTYKKCLLPGHGI